MTFEEGITFIVVWVAHLGACRKCLGLNGYVWTVQSLRGTLVHPEYGPVFDLDAEVSLAHPHCYCGLEVEEIEVDLEALEVG